ncbi:hypothetical protein [Pyrinomonas sp.]|uniref:hypothetical protein n=1 Tax=Pyrinomonas sp. TaxID=2080306 RepID=UPI00331CE51D
MNRKLIRPSLAEIKEREAMQRERAAARSAAQQQTRSAQPSPSASAAVAAPAMPQPRKRIPPVETFAEVFYYKKQMDAHTPMVIVLQDGEEIEGTIEWYDRGAIKVNRKTAPNLLLLKHNIKYMYKAEDRVKKAEQNGERTEEEE